MRMWPKRKPSSPGNAARAGQAPCARARRGREARRPRPPGRSSATVPRQKSRPRPRLPRASARSPGPRRSRRAARSASIVGGRERSAELLTPARALAAAPGREGFPPLPRRFARELVGSRRRRGAVDQQSRSPPGRAARAGATYAACPRHQSGRSSRSSGRARQTSRSGASCVHSTRYSTRSRKVASAQWRSSRTTTSGRVVRQRLEEPAHRPEDLLLARPPASARPSAAARRSTTSGASSTPASSSSTLSRVGWPAACSTSSRSGQ